MVRMTLLMLGLVLLGPGQAPVDEPKDKDDSVKKEMKLLEGTWELVSLVTDGQEVPRRDTGLYSLTLKDGKFAYKTRGGKMLDDGTVQIDPAAEPKGIDLSARGGVDVVGVYELKGDELKVCAGKKRPTKLASEAGSGQSLFTYKRVKSPAGAAMLAGCSSSSSPSSVPAVPPPTVESKSEGWGYGVTRE